jgi:hypothetical protein
VAVRAAGGHRLAAFVVGAVQGLHINRQRPDYDAITRHLAHTGDAAGSPWSTSATSRPGGSRFTRRRLRGVAESRHHSVVRLGSPPLRQVLRAPPFTHIPSAPGEDVAARAARLANGMFVVVLPARVPPELIARMRRQDTSWTHESSLFVKISRILRRLPARFCLVDVYTPTGFNRGRVYTFEA